MTLADVAIVVAPVCNAVIGWALKRLLDRVFPAASRPAA